MSFLHLRIVEAVGLAATDITGFSDPYCKVQVVGASAQSDTSVYMTNIKKKSTDPLWDEYFSFKLTEKDLGHSQLYICIFDSDKGKSKDDVLGYATLDLSVFKSDQQYNGWLPVRGSKRMQNKQQFRDQLKRLQLDLEKNEHKVDSIQRVATDFDYIKNEKDEFGLKQSVTNTSFAFRAAAQDNEEHETSSNSSNESSQNNNNNLNIDIGNYNFSRPKSPNNKNNDKSNENSKNNSKNNSVNSSPNLGATGAPNINQNRTLFRKTGNNESEDLNQTDALMPSGRKLAKYASKYNNKGDIDLAEEEKGFTEYDLNYGVRGTDSARVYIVARFEKMQSFGAVDAKTLKDRGLEKLKLFPSTNAPFPISIFCATYNAGNSRLQSLYDWLPQDDSIDMYVIAFQEMKARRERPATGIPNYMSEDEDDFGTRNDDNNNTNNTNNSNSNLQDSPNKTAIDSNNNNNNNNNNINNTQSHSNIEYVIEDDDYTMGPSQQEEMERLLLKHFGINYKSIGNYKMWMIRIFIFARKEYDERISNVTAHHRAAGVGGIGRNKGGVVISLDFDGISLCFVCAHMTAHQHKTEERNKMYKNLCKNLKVGWPKQQLLGQFHHIFWLGDLNYRIDFEGNEHDKTPKSDTFKRFLKEIMDGNYEKLLKDCQLKTSMHKRNAFVGFQEGKIQFPPTFKVERTKGIQYQQTRLPAWCDRILFRSQDGFNLKYKDYNCNSVTNASDHKPVFCRFYLESWLRAPCINDACKICILKFCNMQAQNLISADINGTSDPFLHFPRQLLLEKFVQSKRCNRTLDPKWKDKKMKELHLIRNSLPFLLKSLLLLQIRDHDTFGSNDIIAYGCISLAKAVEKRNEWVDFRIILTLDGKDAGILEGKMMLVYELWPQYDPKNLPKV